MAEATQPPEVISEVSRSKYASVAKLYGRVTAHGTTYIFDRKANALIRADCYHQYKEQLKHERQ